MSADASSVSEGREVGLTLLQVSAGLEWRRNLAVIRTLVEAVPDEPNDLPRLVVAPEVVMSDFGPPERDLTDVAQGTDGPFVAGLASLARDRRVTLVAGMVERPGEGEAPPGRVFNTLVVADPDGELVATYRKVHLYDAFGFRESDRFAPGADVAVTFGLGGLTFGLMTCYDLRFPEQARALTEAGAHVLVLPAAWLSGEHKVVHWDTLVRARAIESTCYVAACDQGAPHYVGRSRLVDPMGVDVAAAEGDGQTTVAGTVSGRRVDEVRRINPTLANRRPTPG